MGSQVPVFVAERRAGLRDFWAVYEQVVAGFAESSPEVSLGLSELTSLVRASDASELIELTGRARVLLRGAILEDDWTPYVEHTRTIGASYAELGVGFSHWYSAIRVFQRRLVPALVEAYAATPPRLSAAVTAMLELLDFWITHVAEHYLEARQQDRFRLLVDSVKDYAIYMLDPDGVVTSWNVGAQALMGYTADEIVGHSYAEFFPVADREAGRPMQILAIATDAERHEEEAPRVRKDGSLFWADTTVTAIRAGGHLVGFAKVVRDLTERRHAEAERRGLEERFRALARATSDAIITADHRGTITYANHATTAMFDASASELVGQPLTMLMPERMREAHVRGLARYLTSHEPRVLGRTVELPALRRDGTELATEMSIATWTARGEASFAAIIRDVSQRKQIEATLEERTRQLEATNREVEAFSYSVAHDLRAPLRSVSGFTQILLEDHAPRLEREAVNYLTKIHGSVTRMTKLIDALLELSRLSRSELEVKEINVTALTRSVVAQLAAAEPARKVEIAIDGGLRALADARLVRTLLENLVGNAWKFTGRTVAPRIAIGSSDRRTFFVRDNGAGFDMSHARKLFSPFERLHTAEEFPGTGVGLATVRRIVDRHGGRIWAQSQVGEGATFFFTLAPEAS